MRIGNGFRIAAVYAAVILGAGFASGQELLRYFVDYGAAGLWGMMLAGVVFALTGWAVLDICRANGFTSYSSFLSHLLGKRLSFVIELAVAVFLFVLFATMLAAAGATLEQRFHWPFTVGAAVTAVLCFVVLLFDLEGIVRINMVVSPFLVIGGIFIGLYTFFFRTVPVFAGGTVMRGWIWAALVYASYNMVTAIPVLTASARLAEKKHDSFAGGMLGGIAMTVLALCMSLPLYLHYMNIVSAEIPFLVIVTNYGELLTGLYLVIIISAVFTTAVTNAFSLIEWICGHFHFNRRWVAAVLCVACTLVAHVGFSNFVAYAYPLFGVVGIFEVLVILLAWRGARGAESKKFSFRRSTKINT